MVKVRDIICITGLAVLSVAGCKSERGLNSLNTTSTESGPVTIQIDESGAVNVDYSPRCPFGVEPHYKPCSDPEWDKIRCPFGVEPHYEPCSTPEKIRPR